VHPGVRAQDARQLTGHGHGLDHDGHRAGASSPISRRARNRGAATVPLSATATADPVLATTPITIALVTH